MLLKNYFSLQINGVIDRSAIPARALEAALLDFCKDKPGADFHSVLHIDARLLICGGFSQSIF